MIRYLLPLIALGLLLYYSAAGAVTCPTTPDGYVRQYRPDGIPANYPPPAEPACYMIDSQAGASYASCYLCHAALQRRLA
jgi:hypothetical protein